jgi:hypothetical protein
MAARKPVGRAEEVSAAHAKSERRPPKRHAKGR